MNGVPFVVEYLRTHSLRDLYEDHGVCARFSSDFTKVSLNYDQIATKSGDPVAEQCRGMILRVPQVIYAGMQDDESLKHGVRHTLVEASKWHITVIGECEVVAWPMNRFYNHGDGACAPVDWYDPTLRVLEKLDGTMIIMYWDSFQRRWHCATRAVPEADLPIKEGHIAIGNTTFSGLFFTTLLKVYESINDHQKEDFFEDWIDNNFDVRYTYVFELTSKFNRVVVKYNETKITLLAARSIVTGLEEDITWVKCPNHVDHVMSFASLHDPVTIATYVNAQNPADLEGIVVCDSQFNRVKLKSLAWVMSSRAKDLVTVSRRNAVTVILNDKIDDIVALVDKDIADELCSMQRGLASYLKNVEKTFLDIKNDANGDRKSFAARVLATKDWSAPYFAVLDGRGANTIEWIKNSSKEGRLPPKTLDMLLKKIEENKC